MQSLSHLHARLRTMSVGSALPCFISHGNSVSDLVSFSYLFKIPPTCSCLAYILVRIRFSSAAWCDIRALHIAPPHFLTSAHCHIILVNRLTFLPSWLTSPSSASPHSCWMKCHPCPALSSQSADHYPNRVSATRPTSFCTRYIIYLSFLSPLSSLSPRAKLTNL